MKTKLLLSILLFSTLSYAQTFDWENAQLLGSSIVRQTVNGVKAEFISTNVQLIDAAGYGGTTGQVATSNDSPMATVEFEEMSSSSITGFISKPINITSIYVFDSSSSGANNVTWTLTPVGGTNNSVTANVGGNLQGANVIVNWTNVTGFTIQSASGNDGFSLDDIVFTIPPCTVNIPDANFKAELLANTSINTNGDNEIQCSEATAYSGSTSTINVINKNISNLTGIEAFTNVSRLYCNNNNLTNLDVSANTALTRLYCGDNNLGNIDVSANTLLEDFRCNNTNLTSLDVSNNINLFNFECNNNNITTIDLSTNISLQYLFIFSNLITNLDTSSNTALRYIHCYDNNLMSLNLANGNNTQITNSNFNALNNPNLTCVQVDDVSYSNINWNNKDAQTSFSANCPTLSIAEFEINTVSLYPNPTNSVLNIKMKSNLKQATIYSVLGAKIIETKSTTINTSNIKSGVYIITIEDETGNISTKRFIKQ